MRTSAAAVRLGISLLIVFFIVTIIPQSFSAQFPVVRDGDRLGSPFAEVFRKAGPSVVRIEVEGDSRQFPWNTRQQDEKRTYPYEGMGSGVIVDREGHILTNNHVIVKPDQSTVETILVIINDNEEYAAEVVGRDPETDLAVVRMKLDGKLLPEKYVADLGDSDALLPGDYAIAIGNPFGLERTITVGVISALGRYKSISPRGASQLQFKNFIQTDALINPGNSGGALLNINGEVIGINDIYMADSGIGFAIPINLARNVMQQIIDTGIVKRGALGINIDDVTKEHQRDLDLPDREGVLITNVFPETPAEKIGLEKDDVILSLNGEKMKNSNDFQLRVGDLPPGAKIQLSFLRDGEIKNAVLVLADRSEVISNAGSPANWRGIHVVDIGTSQAKKFDLGDIEKGVVIIKIDEGSPAEETTLRPGDVIVEIEDNKVASSGDFLEIKEKYKDLKKPIYIYRMRRQPNGRNVGGYVAVKNK